MDPFVQKIKELGLTVLEAQAGEEVGNINEMMEEYLKKETDQFRLSTLFRYYFRIYVEDVERFKKSFGVSPELDNLFPFVFKKLVMEMNPFDSVDFFLNANSSEIEQCVLKKITSDEKVFSKENREYALKKAFNRQAAIRSVLSEQLNLAEHLISEPEKMINQRKKDKIVEDLRDILGKMENEMRKQLQNN